MPAFTTRVNLNNTNWDMNGRHRVGGVPADAAGDLSGATALGGANGDGTVFDIPSIDGSDAGTPATFDGTNRAYPDAGLTAGAVWDLSGMTPAGGANGDGTVFEPSGTGFQATPSVAPVLSGGGNSVTYPPGGGAVAVDAGLGVSDAESGTLAGATVAIGAGFLAGDTLYLANQNGIAGSYNASTGMLTLTGTASLADYQAALESIIFYSTSENPSDLGTDPSRTVSWTVTDGAQSSNTIYSTISIPTLTTLVSFNITDGAYPVAGLIANAAGDLFGTTEDGGTGTDMLAWISTERNCPNVIRAKGFI